MAIPWLCDTDKQTADNAHDAGHGWPPMLMMLTVAVQRPQQADNDAHGWAHIVLQRSPKFDRQIVDDTHDSGKKAHGLPWLHNPHNKCPMMLMKPALAGRERS